MLIEFLDIYDSEIHYCYDFSLYLGKDGGKKEDKPEPQVIKDLVSQIKNFNIHFTIYSQKG